MARRRHNQEDPADVAGRSGSSGRMTALLALLAVWIAAVDAAEPEAAACPPGEPIQWVADYCMAEIGTDDEIAASDCISRQSMVLFGSECAAKLHFKRALCGVAMKRGTGSGTVDACVRDPAFMGSTVRNGGVGARSALPGGEAALPAAGKHRRHAHEQA
jgi:hypothetical protein